MGSNMKKDISVKKKEVDSEKEKKIFWGGLEIPKHSGVKKEWHTWGDTGAKTVGGGLLP